MARTFQRFLRKNIDLAPLGVERRSDNILYFCTPKGASIFGWAGVDGIHYCFVRGFGEMVFAVSPMDGSPHYVRPLARDFADFLRLLLASGDANYLEQAWQLGESEFEIAVEEYPPTPEQQHTLEQIAQKMELTPMEHPWRYIQEVQRSFDYGKLKYSEEFEETVSDTPPQPPVWEVYFDGNFWGHKQRQRPGKEIPLGVEFDWADRHWYIPAAYACTQGLVIDFCMRVHPNDIRDFVERWDLTPENEGLKHFSREEKMRLNRENPLQKDFNSRLFLNGKELRTSHGSGTAHDPCLPEEYLSEEARLVIQHYGLDPSFGWMMWRSCYPWATKRKPNITSLSITMMEERMPAPGPHFVTSGEVGVALRFCYPDGGREYTLTVHEYEKKTIDFSRMPNQDLEYPPHCHAMSYTLSPEMPDGLMTLSDCAEGDRPKQKQRDPNEFGPTAVHYAGAIGVIGGAGTPVAMARSEGKLRAACSSLHFQPVDTVEWRIVFHEKQFEDAVIPLIQKP